MYMSENTNVFMMYEVASRGSSGCYIGGLGKSIPLVRASLKGFRIDIRQV